MCNLYSITTNQDALRALFRVMNRYVGNLPATPDYPAPPASPEWLNTISSDGFSSDGFLLLKDKKERKNCVPRFGELELRKRLILAIQERETAHRRGATKTASVLRGAEAVIFRSQGMKPEAIN
jgi:hypothetical protein